MTTFPKVEKAGLREKGIADPQRSRDSGEADSEAPGPCICLTLGPASMWPSHRMTLFDAKILYDLIQADVSKISPPACMWLTGLYCMYTWKLFGGSSWGVFSVF